MVLSYVFPSLITTYEIEGVVTSSKAIIVQAQSRRRASCGRLPDLLTSLSGGKGFCFPVVQGQLTPSTGGHKGPHTTPRRPRPYGMMPALN